MLFKIFFSACLASCFFAASAQAVGDYQSFQTGNWNATSTWSRWDGTTWVNPAPATPTFADGAITILNSHVVTINASVNIDQVVIQNGGTIVHSSGTVTISNGTGDDVVIENGGLYRQVISTVMSFSFPATFRVKQGGTLEAANISHIAYPSDITHKFIFDSASVFNFNASAGSLPFYNKTYFPDATASVIPIFKVTNYSSFNASGNGSPTIINGIFEYNKIASAFNPNGAGTITFRNGITGIGQVTQNGTGTFYITGNPAYIGGTGLLQISTNGLVITDTCYSKLISNKTINNTTSGNTTTINGTLQCDDYILSGSTAFVLSANATLKMGSVNGITSSIASGNIQNTGTLRTFSKGANYEYIGTAAQVSGNGIPDSVRSLTINNSLGLTLSNASVTDTAKLALVSGRIKTDATHKLILSKTATISSVANIYGDANEGIQTSFVSGPLGVECNATSLYTIPVGKDTSTGVFFAPVKLTPFNNVTKIYTVNYYPGPYADPTVDGTLHHVSSLEYWDVSCNLSANPDVDALLGLSWRPTSNICFPVCNTADSTAAWSDLVVAHYFNDGSSTKWRMDGGIPPFTMRTGSTLSYGYVTTTIYTGLFSPFTLGSKSDFNFLPLKLTGFSGFAAANAILLEWNTTGERNIKEFELQKSIDGLHFSAIRTTVAGNSLETNQYKEMDPDPKEGYNYYRLKISDNFEKTGYSAIIKIRFRKNASLKIYPNPVENKLFIHPNGNILPGSVQITTASGCSFPAKFKVIGSGADCQIDCSALPTGWYLLKMLYGTTVTLKPFFKK